MKLFENKKTFYDLIETVATDTGISAAQIEKDYYVTILLAELTKRLPGLVFKDGTSLSKCYKIIDRFSEDIDLTLDQYHFTQGEKRKVKYALLDVCAELGFDVPNAEQAKSRRDYNSYDVKYPVNYVTEGIKPIIRVETVFVQKAYPDTIMPATAILYDYLKERKNERFLADYSELQPFQIRVQALERTLIDKVFALCNRYLSNDTTGLSRHIYDLSRLLPFVQLNEDLKHLAKEVRYTRKEHDSYPVEQPNGYDIQNVLREIIDKQVYRKDYETITKAMIYKRNYLPYDEAIKSLEKIIESGVFASE